MCSLEMATCVHEMNGYGGTAAVQIRKSKHIPLATSEAQKAVLSANKKEQRLQVAMWQIAWWEGPEHSWQVRLMLVALGGYKGVFHRNRH